MTEKPTTVVQKIVADALGARPLDVVHVPTLEDSHVYRLRMPSGTVFFKSEHEGHPIDVAAWAYAKAATVDIPVPRVLHVDGSRERWPQEFMIITAVAGTDLEHDPLEGDELVNAIRAFGDLLRRLHTITLDGFGEIELQGSGARGKYSDHRTVVARSVDWSMPYLGEHELVEHSTRARVAEILERHEELFTGPDQAVLLHDDAGLDHLFIDRRSMRITGLIDFEPWAGDPGWDISTFAYHYPHLAEHFIDGYGDGVPDDLDVRIDLYGMARAVGCARWEHERGLDVTRALREIHERSARLGHRLGMDV